MRCSGIAGYILSKAMSHKNTFRYNQLSLWSVRLTLRFVSRSSLSICQSSVFKLASKPVAWGYQEFLNTSGVVSVLSQKKLSMSISLEWSDCNFPRIFYCQTVQTILAPRMQVSDKQPNMMILGLNIEPRCFWIVFRLSLMSQNRIGTQTMDFTKINFLIVLAPRMQVSGPQNAGGTFPLLN